MTANDATCFAHADRRAGSTCHYCGRGLCNDCAGFNRRGKYSHCRDEDGCLKFQTGTPESRASAAATTHGSPPGRVTTPRRATSKAGRILRLSVGIGSGALGVLAVVGGGKGPPLAGIVVFFSFTAAAMVWDGYATTRGGVGLPSLCARVIGAGAVSLLAGFMFSGWLGGGSSATEPIELRLAGLLGVWSVCIPLAWAGLRPERR